MSCQEQQEEEVEVLNSIYEGDDTYQAVNSTTHQLKLGEDGGPHSFVLEVVWGEDYPEAVPTINLDCFYNKHILEEVKADVVQKVLAEAEQNIGCAMTYTLFEWVKENVDSLMENQPLAPVQQPVVEEKPKEDNQPKAKVKKVQLTKAQKRKITNHTNIKGERPRGWDWVDIIRHLSQTGRCVTEET